MPTKVCIVKAMGFPVVAYRCESCTIKKAERQRIDSLDCGVGDDFLDCKEIKPVNPKGNQSWVFTGRTDAEAETPIVWPPDAKSWLAGKDPDAGKDWGQQEKGMTEDEMVGWDHRVYGHEFEQALGDGEGWWSLVCCSPWGCKELDTAECPTVETWQARTELFGIFKVLKDKICDLLLDSEFLLKWEDIISS